MYITVKGMFVDIIKGRGLELLAKMFSLCNVPSDNLARPKEKVSEGL